LPRQLLHLLKAWLLLPGELLHLNWTLLPLLKMLLRWLRGWLLLTESEIQKKHITHCQKR